jgi:hypothetical protein
MSVTRTEGSPSRYTERIYQISRLSGIRGKLDDCVAEETFAGRRALSAVRTGDRHGGRAVSQGQEPASQYFNNVSQI